MDPRGNFQNEDQILQRKNHGMLGGVEGLDLSSKTFISCASRTESWAGSNPTLSYMQGSCYMRPRSYLLQNTLPVPIPASIQLNPFTVPKKEESQANYQDNRNSEAGFSVHFARSGNELVITAPGRHRSMGSIIQYVSRDGGTNFEQSFVHVQPQCPQSRLGCFQYFGYSVTSGYYFTDIPSSPNSAVNSGPPMQYAIGTPRANNMTGNVLIVQFPERQDGKLQILQELKLQDSQIGWYFGASLLTLDVNGDGKDDLIVGAPRYSRDQSPRFKVNLMLSRVVAPEGLAIAGRAGYDRFGGYGDEGAAFIYLSNGVKLMKHTILNGGNRAWSQFGTAMTSLGDLNTDGYKDFAVSAPFEDNSGAVYIYHGNQAGTFKDAAQIIYAKHIDTGLRGFGFSLTGNEDIDNNGINDLAIGSFNSSQTVILRSKPVINVQGTIKSTQTKLEMNIKAFLVTSCISFTGDHAPNNAEFSIRLIADSNFQHSPRVHITFADEDKQQGKPTSVYIEFKETVTSGREICTDFNAIVKAPLETSGAAVVFKQEVSIQQAGSQSQVKPRWMKINSKSATFSVSGEDFSKFCKNCPLISKRQPSELSLPLAVPCGDDDICHAELELDISFRNVPDKGFMVGSASSVTMDIKMTNHKETAIAPGVLVTWWRLKLKRIPGDCSPVVQLGLQGNKVTYRCNLGKLLEEGKSATVSLEFDMTSFVVSDKSQVEEELIWNVTAVTVSHVTRSETQSVMLPLSYQADPYISGSRYLEIFNPDTLQPYTVFKHVYEVNMDGPSPVGDILVVFQLPVNITTEDETVVHVRTVVEASGLMSCQPTKGHFSQSDASIEFPDVMEDPDFDAAGIGGLLPIDKDVSRGSNTSFVENDRLLIHCDSPFVACMEVTCKSAVYYPGTTTIISFPIDISAEMIRRLMKMHKVSAIQVESKGKLVLSQVVQNIQPKPHQPDETVAVTIIEKEGYKRVSKWVYTLAVVIGILVLACVIFCLYSVCTNIKIN